MPAVWHPIAELCPIVPEGDAAMSCEREAVYTSTTYRIAHLNEECKDKIIIIIKNDNDRGHASSTKLISTGLWSEQAKPVSMTEEDVTRTLSDTRKPSTVRTYWPS